MKKILILLALFAFTISCKKEVVEPTPPPTTIVADDEFDHIIVASDPSAAEPIDSIVYVNQTTGVSETILGSAYVTETCGGIDSELQSFALSENYVSGDGCEITIHFDGVGEYKIFQVLLLKPTESFCEDLGGQATVYHTTLASYLVSRNL